MQLTIGFMLFIKNIARFQMYIVVLTQLIQGQNDVRDMDRYRIHANVTYIYMKPTEDTV